MWRSLAKHTLAGLAGAAVMVTTAVPALASFVRLASESQSVTTGTLAAPTGLGVVEGPCQKGKSVSAQVTWTPTASAFATGYEVWRDGAVIGTVSGQTSDSFLDTTVDWSTTYSYTVRAVRNYWSSTLPAAASFTTPAKSCK